MAYVVRYEENKSKGELANALKNIPENVLIGNVKGFTIGDFYESNKEGGFIYGKIAVKRKSEDFNFKRDEEDYEIEKTPKEYYIYDEVTFTIFPDLKIISFASKNAAKLFGIDILSRILFGDFGKIGNVIFYPQKVLEAKEKGFFKNVWFNGVRFDGKIQYAGQFGNEIDEDIEYFLDNPERRMGIGVELLSKTGYTLKVAVYLEGTLLCHTKMKDFKDNIIVTKEIITNFIPYSNYNQKLPDKIVDEYVSLNNWLE